MVLIQAWPPHLALAPIAQADPPFMPFRDAGYAPADFVLTIQDVVYGVWRAKEQKLIDIRSFNLEEYELYERVDQGDFNEIAPHFVAFASPQQSEYDVEPNYPFQQVLDYFLTHDIQLVVRLNSHLYDKNEFEKRGIKHIDLVFEDGTCPTMEFVQAFLGAVEGVIAQNGKVAVHCKAGLGRTGCLIGAHLIYTYGFTAAEVIAYMRFLRPGMVVGPQQHWLYLHQNEFRDWRRTMTVSHSSSEKLAGFCPLVPRTHNNSQSQRSANSHKISPPRTPERSIRNEVNNHNSALPVPTPGQPRKNSPTPAGRFGGNSVAAPRNASPMAKRYVPNTIGQFNSDDEETDESFQPQDGKSDQDDYDSSGIYNDAEEEDYEDEEDEDHQSNQSSASLSDETLNELANSRARKPKFLGNSFTDEDEVSQNSMIGQEASQSPSRRESGIQIAKRSGRKVSTSSTGPLQSRSSRRISIANVTTDGSPERRKSSNTSTVGEFFGDQENNLAIASDSNTPEGKLIISKNKRTVTDSLSQKQQMMMMRNSQMRSTSNPSPQLRGRGGGSRAASFQMLTTTTTTTTTTTLSSSPPTKAAAAAAAAAAAIPGVDGGSVVRLPNKIVSGIRKTSGGSLRGKR